jgi:prenyl protein peptidase
MILEVSAWQALLWAALTPVVFIGSIFVFKPDKADRDHPREILRRFLVIGAAALLWPSLMFVMFGKDDDRGPRAITWLGLQVSLNSYVAVLCSLAATLVLFSGPLYCLVFTDNAPTEFNIKAVQAFIAAPIYEELCFRSTLMCPLLASGYSIGTSNLLSAVIFGLSHFYHWFEGQRRRGDCVISLFQVSFSTILGLYAAYIFTATGSLYACVTVHGFCNFMGFPDLGFMNNTHPAYRFRRSVVITYLMGIGGFLVLCPLMLDSRLFDSWPSRLGA